MVCMAQLLGFHPNVRVIYNSSPLRNSPHSSPPKAVLFHAMSPKRMLLRWQGGDLGAFWLAKGNRGRQLETSGLCVQAEMAQTGRAFAKETKQDLDFPELVSMQWLACDSSWHHVRDWD